MSVLPFFRGARTDRAPDRSAVRLVRRAPHASNRYLPRLELERQALRTLSSDWIRCVRAERRRSAQPPTRPRTSSRPARSLRRRPQPGHLADGVIDGTAAGIRPAMPPLTQRRPETVNQDVMIPKHPHEGDARKAALANPSRAAAPPRPPTRHGSPPAAKQPPCTGPQHRSTRQRSMEKPHSQETFGLRGGGV